MIDTPSYSAGPGFEYLLGECFCIKYTLSLKMNVGRTA
jgi:hypothetical protein